jgi:hypothetical protein
MQGASVETRLKSFHKRRAGRGLSSVSPIVSPKFGVFNVSPFLDKIINLGDHASSFWGVDRCLRIEEAIDGLHSRIFHLAAFARSIGSHGRIHDRWHSEQFVRLQEDTLRQLLALFAWFRVDWQRLQATYFGGLKVGGYPDRVDRMLKRSYRLPEDNVSARVLRQHEIKAIRVAAVANLRILQIAPRSKSLVAMAVEFHLDDIEVATGFFGCYRVKNGLLQGVNYVAGYAIGIERLTSALAGKDFLEVVPRYKQAHSIIERRIKAARLPIMAKDVREVLFGLEALAHLSPRQSHRNMILINRMKGQIKQSIHNLGLSFDDVKQIHRAFAELDPRSI